MPRLLASPFAEVSESLFAGTSGWAYPSWKPGFYPTGVSAKKFLGHYASRLNSVEVNYTFTKLPSSATVADWLAQTPPGFRFSFKAPQRITHFRRLVDCEVQLQEFFDCLKPFAKAGKLGVVLFQLPPNFKANSERMQTFLSLQAFRGKACPPVAFEFRHVSWFAEEHTSLLAEHKAALCLAETEDWQTPEIYTAPGHVAYRLRRTGGYKPREIKVLVERLSVLARKREVYAYFKHEDEPTGALNAVAFRRAAQRLVR